MNGKIFRKPIWSGYWKLHDRRKQLEAGFKGYLDGLPQKTRRYIVLVMLAAFAALAIHSFCKAVHDIGRGGNKGMEIGHAGRVELPVRQKTDNHLIPYLYGTDEE